MQVEIRALEDSTTWELTQLPKYNKAIGCKWVYKVKYTVEEVVDRFKAKLVTKGGFGLLGNILSCCECLSCCTLLRYTPNGCFECFPSR